MENRNISIARKNGYTYEKVMKAKQYLEEIGSNRRNFDFVKLVGYYNEILGTNDSPNGCRCQSPKYYTGIQNYFKYGKMTLIANGLATEADFELKEDKPEEIAENRINLGTEAISEPSEASKDEEGTDTKAEEKEAVTEEKKKGRKKKEQVI